MVLARRVVLICPGCVTVAERRAIEADWIAAEDEARREAT
jgi:hypothetical protein